MTNQDQAPLSESKLHFLDYWRVIRVRYGIILLAFLLVVITTGVTTYYMPRQYRSSVFMQISNRMQSLPLFGGDDGGSRNIDTAFTSTQFEILQRKEILYPVLRELGLAQRWGEPGKPMPEEFAFNKLRGSMEVRAVRGTDLIQVDVYSEIPAEAAEIANKIADVYVQRRIDLYRDTQQAALGTLDDEVDKAEKETAELRNKLYNLAEELGIVDLNPIEIQVPGELDEKRLLEKHQEVMASDSRLTKIESLLRKINELSLSDLLSAMTSLNIADPVVGRVQPLLSEAQAQRARMAESGLGPRHPQVRELDALIAKYQEQLQTGLETIENSLQTSYNVEKDANEKLKAQLKELEQDLIESRRLRQEYAKIKVEYNEARRLLEAARLRLQTRMMELQLPLEPATVWEYAEESSAPARPNVFLHIALGVIVGLLSGVGLAFFIEYLDTSVKTMEDVETFLGVPVLAVIPKGINLLHTMPTESADAEAYRIMRTNIEFNRKSADANAVSIVSGGSGEGKSTTLANLSYICAQGGYNVLLVDADLRRPVQHKLFGVSNSIGLTNYLTTNVALEDVIIQTAVDNLYLMPSGVLPSDAVGILNSQRMSDMIAELKTRFDLVFFDSPPILGVSDASVLASEVDLTIIVVQHRRFPRNMLLRVKQAVQNVGGTVLGVVLNNVDLKHDPNYEYYTSYYHYYYKTPGRVEAPATSSAVTGGSRREEEFAVRPSSRRAETDEY